MPRVISSIHVNLPAPAPLSREAFFARKPLTAGCLPTPRMAIGTAGLGGAWDDVHAHESVEVLRDAWRGGFLMTDSSPNYGDGAAEQVIEEALRGWQGPSPVLCTKIDGWGDLFVPRAGETWRQAMERQVETSTRRFGDRRIDGLAMHDAEGCPAEFLPACVDYLLELRERKQVGCIAMGGGGPGVQLPVLKAHPGKFRYVITYLRINAINLQGLADLGPAANEAGTGIVTASPIFMGVLGPKLEQHIANPRGHFMPVFQDRARAAAKLAAEAGLPLSHLALRFLLSTPGVEFVLAGADTPATWADTAKAYEAGPLPGDLYERVWRNAQAGQPEPIIGG
ncbi:MAG: aldo/keto reductase [Planctomycetota bacterium]|nr:aldo/keto reductase [Planctomycetota bacterium]